MITLVLAAALAQSKDWEKAEAASLKNITQITFPDNFVRAGEGYFSPDGKSIVFQGEEKGSGNPFYQIFTMELATKKFRRVSTGVGKTTCAYFSPDGKKLIFAATHLDPTAKEHYAKELEVREEERKSKKRRKYSWDFDSTFDIFETDIDGARKPKRLTTALGYDAEGSYSADGKHIVFCSNRSGKENLEIYIMDADGGNARKLTDAPGCYNGGPFFSPDGKRVIFRADRKKKDHLQIYVIGVDGKNERILTEDLDWVQWCPFWYKDSRHIVYAAADHAVKGRPNYDVYWMDVDTKAKTRVTFAPGADVLPAFSPDGSKMLWTSTRGDERGGGQLFLADFTPPKGK
jgi:TolB protein